MDFPLWIFYGHFFEVLGFFNNIFVWNICGCTHMHYSYSVFILKMKPFIWEDFVNITVSICKPVLCKLFNAFTHTNMDTHIPTYILENCLNMDKIYCSIKRTNERRSKVVKQQQQLLPLFQFVLKLKSLMKCIFYATLCNLEEGMLNWSFRGYKFRLGLWSRHWFFHTDQKPISVSLFLIPQKYIRSIPDQILELEYILEDRKLRLKSVSTPEPGDTVSLKHVKLM